MAGGITWHVLNGPRWRRTSRGYYLPALGVPATPAQRIVEAAAALPPGAAIGGWAAAYACGADLLDGLDDLTMRPLPVTMCLPPGLHRPPTPGRRYLQRRLDDSELTSRAGIPITTPVRTAFDLVVDTPDPTEAVVALDAMLAAGLVDPLQLMPSPGRRGAGSILAAVQLARRGVRSTWETRLRMLDTSELGFPCPLVNSSVTDLDGRFLGTPDLLDVEAGLVLEYDGSRWTGSEITGGHRDRDQHRADNVREELLERAGLIVVRAESGDLRRHRPRLRARLAAARADGLQRDRRRDRWALPRSSSRQSRFSPPDDRDYLLPGRPRLTT